MAALPLLAHPAELAALTGRSESDLNLVAQLRAASRRFRSAVHHDVTLTVDDVVEARGDGGASLILPAFPIVLDPDSDPARTLTVTVDGDVVDPSRYRVAKALGMLELVSGAWPRGVGRIQVTYSHGYIPTLVAAADGEPARLDGVPEDIQAAVLAQAQILMNVTPGLQQRTVLGDMVSFGTAAAVGATQEWSEAVENYKLRYGA